MTKEQREQQNKDLIGQTLNNWTVLKHVRKKVNKEYSTDHFLCSCSCGNLRTVRKYSLFGKGRITKKCSECSAKEQTVNRAGEVYGQITIIKFAKRIRKRTYWEGTCSCGYTHVWGLRDLYRKRENYKGLCQHATGEDPKTPQEQLLNSYSKGASGRNLEFQLNLSQFSKLIKGDCHYCGTEPRQKKAGILYNGIGRKDNKKGYIVKNCVSCCKFCNYAKRAKPYRKFMSWVRRVSEYNK